MRFFLVMQVVAAFSLLKRNLRIEQLTGHRWMQYSKWIHPSHIRLFLRLKIYPQQGLEAWIEGSVEEHEESVF